MEVEERLDRAFKVQLLERRGLGEVGGRRGGHETIEEHGGPRRVQGTVAAQELTPQRHPSAGSRGVAVAGTARWTRVGGTATTRRARASLAVRGAARARRARTSACRSEAPGTRSPGRRQRWDRTRERPCCSRAYVNAPNASAGRQPSGAHVGIGFEDVEQGRPQRMVARSPKENAALVWVGQVSASATP